MEYGATAPPCGSLWNPGHTTAPETDVIALNTLLVSQSLDKMKFALAFCYDYFMKKSFIFIRQLPTEWDTRRSLLRIYPALCLINCNSAQLLSLTNTVLQMSRTQDGLAVNNARHKTLRLCCLLLGWKASENERMCERIGLFLNPLSAFSHRVSQCGFFGCVSDPGTDTMEGSQCWCPDPYCLSAFGSSPDNHLVKKNDIVQQLSSAHNFQ